MSVSQRWAQENLPRGPLVAHLTSLHALFVTFAERPVDPNVRAMFEQHLVEIGRFTKEADWTYVTPPGSDDAR